MLEGFVTEDVAVGDDVVLRVRHGGSGPVVVLLHGHPRTSATWHRVAPRLVDAGYRVVCPDLRGYGSSSKPPPRAGAYSKRAMARDVRRLLAELGHDSASVVGHDRGSYVAHRFAVDHADACERVAVLDGVPIGEALRRCDARFAERWWHWFFFAQPDLPERAILADPMAWYGGTSEHMGDEAWEEYSAAITDPETVRGMLEDYRAGLREDRAADDADRAAGRRVTRPLLVLWSLRDDLELLYGDPVAVWREWADDVRGHGIDSGHHMAEEAPEALTDALLAFLGERRPDRERGPAAATG